MRRTLTSLALVAACVVLTACEPPWDEGAKHAKRPCGPAPTARIATPTLPGKFPNAKGLVYTGLRQDGPTTVVEGFTAGTSIGDAHTLFATTIRNTPGFQVTHEEQDAGDSEVNFRGNGRSGQVKMVQGCKSRTTVTITIRPA
jgi:hypothetical protein